MKEIKLTNQHKILIGMVGLVVPIMVYFQMIKPIDLQITQKKSDLAGLQAKLNEAIAISSELVPLEADIANIKLSIKQTEKKLPTSKEIPQLLRDITASAEKFGISIQNFTPQATGEKQYYMEIPISLTISTSYHRFAEFAAEIGQFERIIKTENVQLTPIGSAENPNTTVNVNFRFITYAYRG
ncbi:MAG: type 4a pilus biogenesis protein PilO [Elusimicrobiota bacterium]